MVDLAGSACYVKSVKMARYVITQEWLGRLSPNLVCGQIHVAMHSPQVMGDVHLHVMFPSVSYLGNDWTDCAEFGVWLEMPFSNAFYTTQG